MVFELLWGEMKSRLIVLLLCVLFLLHFVSTEEFWKLYQAPVNDKEREGGERERPRERERGRLRERVGI